MWMIFVFHQQQRPIRAKLVDIAAEATQVNILIHLKHCSERALREISSELDELEHVHEKADKVRRHLTAHAATSQRSVHALLDELDAHHAGNVRRLWITNQVAVFNATRHLMTELAALEEVEMIRENTMHAAVETVHEGRSFTASNPTSWAHAILNVERVWSKGNYGQHAIGGFIDSGVDPNHVEMQGKTILAWKDFVAGRTEIYDDYDHGLHVTATAVGRVLGLAQASPIVVCKAFNGGGMLTSAIIDCAQWMLCPDGDCTKTPHVINNSWSFFSSWDHSFEKFTNAWRDAGIIAVAATGNNFRAQTCFDFELKPPSSFDSVISVGSTNEQDRLSYFSRRGSFQYPSKPDITAPGSNIVSASTDAARAYIARSGTSMAVAHVVGTVLMMVSEARQYNVRLTVDEVRTILRQHAQRDGLLPPYLSCDYKNEFPNLSYGGGRLDVYAAVSNVH